MVRTLCLWGDHKGERDRQASFYARYTGKIRRYRRMNACKKAEQEQLADDPWHPLIGR